MGISLPSADLKKIKRDKKIAAILKELQDLDTFEDLQIEDGVAQETHSVTIESENDLSKIEELSQLLEKLSLVLVEMEIDHYVTWFEGTFAQSSGDLYENLLYPVVYADAFWDEDGVEQQLHVTNTEIFCMIS
jgi:hypothetical protein